MPGLSHTKLKNPRNSLFTENGQMIYRVFQIGVYTFKWSYIFRTKNCTTWINTHQKKAKSMPFYKIQTLFENNIREIKTITSNTNAEIWKCIFVNFLQRFLLNFTNFCLYSTFNINRQEQVLKTCLPLDTPQKKLHEVRSRLPSGHENAAHHTTRRSPNFCFKHWMTELIACRVATSY